MSNDEFVIEPQQANLLEIELLGSYAGIGSDNIHVDTTAGWEAQPELIAKLGHLYVYSDYDEKDGVDIPAIKVGDGVSLVVDLPFTTVDLTDIETAISAIQSALEGKVDKVEGKGLSTNDFTDADVTKLNGIETGAEVNVQADWNQTDSSADDYIKNKPSVTGAVWGSISGTLSDQSDLNSALGNKVDKVQGKGLSTEDFTTAEKTKLEGIEAGAQVNTVTGVKGDAETDYRTGNINITKTNLGLSNVDNTSDLNKPISTATQTALDGKVDKVTGKGLSENDYTTADKDKLAGIAAGAEVNVQSDWNEADSTADDYIKNKPAIPAKTSDLQNDSGFITGVAWGGIGGTLADQADLNNELTALNAGLSSAVKSVNDKTPDANGNVDIDATNIPTSSGVAIKSLTGNPLTIADALQGRALGVNATIEPIQDLHGYDHPWAGGSTANLLMATPYCGTYAAQDGTDLKPINPSEVQDYSFSSDMQTVIVNITKAWRGRIFATKPLSAGDYYCAAWIVNSANYRGSIYITDSDFVVQSTVANQSGNGVQLQRVVTVTEGQRIAIFIGSSSAYTVGVTTFQVNADSTPTTYYPFENICPISGISTLEIANNGTTEVTVSLGQTVYGGTLNVIGGELVSDKAIVDMGTLTWAKGTQSGKTVFFASLSDGDTADDPYGICSIYPTSYDASYSVDKVIRMYGSQLYNFCRVAVRDSAYDEFSTDDFKTAMSGAQLVYELRTSLAFTLTPAQLNLLSSTNILTTNAEELTVRYYATGQQGNVEGNIAFLLGQTASNASAINSLTASVAPEETSPATATHATGTYLMYQNRLYKAIAPILVGETLTAGTNIQATTIMEELLALTA